MMQIELAYKTTTIGMSTYFNTSRDWMIELVLQHENQKKLRSVTKEAHKYERELDSVTNVIGEEGFPATKYAKIAKHNAKKNG